jgi:hypothetical protein
VLIIGRRYTGVDSGKSQCIFKVNRENTNGKENKMLTHTFGIAEVLGRGENKTVYAVLVDGDIVKTWPDISSARVHYAELILEEIDRIAESSDVRELIRRAQADIVHTLDTES